jgi:hypothetical protein
VSVRPSSYDGSVSERRSFWRLVAEKPLELLRRLTGESIPEAQPAARTVRHLDLDPRVWGEPPAEGAVARGRALNEELWAALVEVVKAQSLSEDELLSEMQVDSAVLDHMVARREILQFCDDEQRLFPRWQFEADFKRLLPGISRLAETFPGDVLALSEWAVTPNVDLEDTTPRAALEEGRVDEVITASAAITAAAH